MGTFKVSYRGLLPTLLLFIACGAPSDGTQPNQPTRTRSASGYTVIFLPQGASGSSLALEDPIAIGAEGEAGFILISDVEVSATHGIVALDTRASELRRFRLSGQELPLLARSGAGPGEIGSAIGLAVQADGTVWVNDFGNSRYSWFPPESGLGSTNAQDLRQRGLLDGGVTQDGQPWVRVDHSAGGLPSVDGGLIVAPVSTYLARVNLGRTDTADSIFLGTSSFRTADLPRGLGSRRVQYTAERLVAFDPMGAVWTARSDRYHLVRLDLRGDTTLVLNVDAQAVPIPEGIRSQELATLEEWFRSVNAEVPSLDDFVPWEYPLIDKLTVDNGGRVWVQRRGEQGTLFELYTSDGRPAGRFHIDISPWEWGTPAVGDNHLVLIVQDSLEVQSLLAYPLPR